MTVHDALYTKRFEPNADLFNLTGAGAASIGAAAPAPTLPLRFDVHIDAPSTLRIENNLARMVASADLRLQGTYDRPVLLGTAQIERGDVIFEGNRYLVTRGTVGFANPSRIEPYFDIEAETRVRVPNQTYRITLGFTGTTAKIAMNLNSDPPLSGAGIVLLLFGQTTDLDEELRTLNPTATTRTEEDLLKAATARLLTGSLSAPVGRAVEQAIGVDLQITPSIGSETLSPSRHAHPGQAHLEPGVRDVRPSAAATPHASRSSCWSTIRTSDWVGCSRRTARPRSRSISACSTDGEM